MLGSLITFIEWVYFVNIYCKNKEAYIIYRDSLDTNTYNKDQLSVECNFIHCIINNCFETFFILKKKKIVWTFSLQIAYVYMHMCIFYILYIYVFQKQKLIKKHIHTSVHYNQFITFIFAHMKLIEN